MESQFLNARISHIAPVSLQLLTPDGVSYRLAKMLLISQCVITYLKIRFFSGFCRRSYPRIIMAGIPTASRAPTANTNPLQSSASISHPHIVFLWGENTAGMVKQVNGPCVLRRNSLAGPLIPRAPCDETPFGAVSGSSIAACLDADTAGRKC